MKDEMDILREVSSIAAAHGGVALSEMLQRKISLELPSLETASPNEVFHKIPIGKPVISVQCRILSGIPGSIILIFEEESAFELINMCYPGDDAHKKEGITEVGFSVLKEIGNIVIGSYVGALSIILKTPIIPSIPTLINGPLREALGTFASSYDTEDYVLLIEAFFEEVDKKVKGKLYFILTPKTIKEIQVACKRLLEDINK